jgi:hypothetical protein
MTLDILKLASADWPSMILQTNKDGLTPWGLCQHLDLSSTQLGSILEELEKTAITRRKEEEDVKRSRSVAWTQVWGIASVTVAGWLCSSLPLYMSGFTVLGRWESLAVSLLLAAIPPTPVFSVAKGGFELALCLVVALRITVLLFFSSWTSLFLTALFLTALGCLCPLNLILLALTKSISLTMSFTAFSSYISGAWASFWTALIVASIGYPLCSVSISGTHAEAMKRWVDSVEFRKAVVLLSYWALLGGVQWILKRVFIR